MFFRFFPALVLVFSFIAPAFAQDQFKPDDVISFDLSAEDWVSAKTAHVTLDIEAAVGASNAGSMRADMTKAVSDAAKADWRLTNFVRLQDQTGMERWSVVFDARLPESSLNGLADAVKKASKPGMQIKIGGIDFSPSHDELEAARAGLRAKLLKDANEQLAALNAALPGRGYRVSQITFDSQVPAPVPMFRAKPMIAPAPGMVSGAAGSVAYSDADQAQNVSQKLVLDAHVIFAAVAPVSAPAAAH